MTVKERIEELFAGGRLAFKTERQIFDILKIRPAERKAAGHILSELEKSGIILKNNAGEYCTPAQIGAVSGVLQGNERGFAFLIPDGKTADMKDYFIPRHSLHGALDGDRVLAVKIKGTEDEASVIKILSRGHTDIAGTFERMGSACYVVPDSAKFVQRIFVPSSLAMEAKDGDKVVCRITAYPQGKAPNGKVIEILGRSGDFYAEELSIIRNYGLYEEFREEEESGISSDIVFVLTCHPQVIGRPSRMTVLENVIQHINSCPDVEFVTMGQAVADYKKRHGMA